MSDLGSKAALLTDIDAKVTTNGANENTGARVNQCLENIVDTLDGLKANNTITDFLLVYGAGTPGANGVYPYLLMNAGKPSYNDGARFVSWGVETNKWSIGENSTYYYNSTDDVATPDLATFVVTGSGAGPVPGIELFTGTIQEAVQALAALIGQFINGPELRTGSTIAFDAPAIYNTPTTPSSGAVSLDLSGAVPGQVVAYFDHAAEPTWPAGVTAVGAWNDSSLNVVTFTYYDDDNISAEIVSDAAGASSFTWQGVVKTTATVRNNTATLAADPDMKVTMAANSNYLVRMTIAAVAAASSDFKYQLLGPASPTLIRGIIRSAQTSGTAPATRVIAAYDTTDQAMVASSGFTLWLDIEIYIENGANAGDFEFQWAQNAAVAENTTVSRGAYVEYKLVS